MAVQGEILLATDLSGRSDRSTERATILSRQLGAPLAILHVRSSSTDKETVEAIERVLRSDFELPVDCRIIVRDGSPPLVIAEAAKTAGSTMIVTGIARFDEVSDFVIGTTVDRLVRVTDSPVLVVKRRPRRPYSRILAATDFSKASVTALRRAAEIFPGATLRVVNIYRPVFEGFLPSETTAPVIRQERHRALNKMLRELDAGLRTRLDSGLAEGELINGLNEEIASWQSDLLVIGSHGTSGFVHATIGSKAADILNCVAADVMVVKATQH